MSKKKFVVVKQVISYRTNSGLEDKEISRKFDSKKEAFDELLYLQQRERYPSSLRVKGVDYV